MNTVFKKFCLCVVLCLLLAHPVYAEKDKKELSLTSAMIIASASMGQIQNLLTEGNHFAVAEKFMQLARVFKSLERTRPQKGSKAEWDSIHQDIITLSFKAIGACADEDTAIIRAYVQQILNYMQAGHKMFR